MSVLTDYKRALKALAIAWGIKDAHGIDTSDNFGKTARTVTSRLAKAKAPLDFSSPAKVALYILAHKTGVHYSEDMSKRMLGVTKKIRLPKLPTYFDCTSFITYCYWMAGYPDPNEQKYDGYGYGGTLWQHGEKIPLSEAEAGDVALYGTKLAEPGIEHGAIFVSPTQVVSMGQEGGPYKWPVHYRNDLLGVFRYPKK